MAAPRRNARREISLYTHADKARRYTLGMQLASHTLTAHAAASANKIHDDTVAQQYGFRGGLVPGVSVYASMTYPLVGEPMEVRGVPLDKFEKKGHACVVLDVVLLAGGEAVQWVKHTCIFRPRQSHHTER